MTIGLPRALLYYRFGRLWETFFRALGCGTITSGDTTREILRSGASVSVDESCLPLKIYMGHVKALIGRCDYILVPRFSDFGRGEELCVRFQGIYDSVRCTFPEAPLICYSLQESRGRSQRSGFLGMGRFLGKSRIQSTRAYEEALTEQKLSDTALRLEQEALFERAAPRVLIAAQPYLAHDAHIGKPVADMLSEQGCVPVFSDRCDRAACRARSGEISASLYWTMNKETAGSIPLCGDSVDGVVLMTAFPCGTDCLVNELVLRRPGGVPMIQLVLDEHQAEAGLQTRIESFADIIRDRRRACGGQDCN